MDTRTIQRNPANFNKYETKTPHIPIHDMTQDGRVGILKRSVPGGAPIYILKPERVLNYLTDSANGTVGARIIDSSANALFNSDLLKAYYPQISTNYLAERTFLCEKTLKRRNPYICSGDRDCYDVTFITRFNYAPTGTVLSPNQMNSYLVAVDATLKVRNPKTSIAGVELLTTHFNTRRIGPPLPYPKVAEPVVVGDNRLLIVRLGKANDLNLSDGTPSQDGINIVYSTYPAIDASGQQTEQCDVTKWTPQNMHPIAHAHYDTTNKMKERYKFARYPFRDSLGKLLLGDHDLGGSYQWMDKNATNLFYTAIGTDNFYNTNSGSLQTPYAEPTVANYFFPDNLLEIDFVEEKSSPTAGITMLGFWTHGKAVLIDGQLNNSDYNFRIADRVDSGSDIHVQRFLDLYSQESASYVLRAPAGQEFEPVGGVRERGDAFDPNEYHNQLSLNSSFLGSVENRFTYVKAMFPVTIRDVVWHFGSTRHTEELVFDDYINPYMFINAEMTAPVGQPLTNSMSYYDGILNGRKQPQVPFVDVEQPQNGQLLFQNAATALTYFMRVPRYGVPYGNLRMEPIAKGGIYGKGVWFDGGSGIRFPIPVQTGLINTADRRDWYVSAFFDPREVDASAKERVLWSLSSGEKVLLIKANSGTSEPNVAYDLIALRDSENRTIAQFNFVDSLKIRNKKWNHIAIQFFSESLPVLFIDGYRAGNFVPAPGVTLSTIINFFKVLGTGSINLGATHLGEAGVRGWLDDFKVIAASPTSEERCNHARGMDCGRLVGVEPA